MGAYILNIGKKVHKQKSGKPFKSGRKINTVKGIIDHPILHVPAYTFYEDESFVECRRCEVVEINIEYFYNVVKSFIVKLFNKI